MKNKIKIFENESFGQMRMLNINNEIWFVGKDIAECLGYRDTKDAIKVHIDEDDKQIIQRGQNTALEIPNRGLTIINESGLYSLILSSKLEKAKEFKRWVTSEVLPSIRQTGSYETKENRKGVSIFEREKLTLKGEEVITLQSLSDEFMINKDTLRSRLRKMKLKEKEDFIYISGKDLELFKYENKSITGSAGKVKLFSKSILDRINKFDYSEKVLDFINCNKKEI